MTATLFIWGCTGAMWFWAGWNTYRLTKIKREHENLLFEMERTHRESMAKLDAFMQDVMKRRQEESKPAEYKQ